MRNNPIRNVRKRFFYKFKILKLRFFLNSILKMTPVVNPSICLAKTKLKLKKALKPINVRPYLYLQNKTQSITGTLSLLQGLLLKLKKLYLHEFTKTKLSNRTRGSYKTFITSKKTHIVSYWDKSYLKHFAGSFTYKKSINHTPKQFYLKWFR